MMNQDVKQKWLAKLRDGTRVQGRGALRFVDREGTVRQCCLDVLHEVAVEEGVITPPILDVNQYYYLDEDGDRESGTLTSQVVNWAELDSADPSIDAEGVGSSSLSGLNDTEGYTFEEIADVIEEQL